ncbi:MAG: FHIPEP family type III secretion protein [Acidobacteriia bacterium]|nr:FHIPEP family type III secretion protein [Terriglobia bacterium]
MELPDLALRLAKVYEAAALAAADMSITARTLEDFRGLLAQDKPYDAWTVLAAGIGHADPDKLRPILVDLQNWFTEQVRIAELASVRKAFAHDASEGCAAWMNSFARALASFRIKLCLALCHEPFPFPDPFREQVGKVERWSWLLSQERFPEAYQLFIHVLEAQVLPVELQGKIALFAAQIQLYHLDSSEKALVQLEQAERLAPHDCEVVCGVGEYWLRHEQHAKAEEYFRRGLSLGPDESTAYAHMGDLHASQGKLQSAEEWYQKALNAKLADENDCLKALRFFGRPGLFDSHKQQLIALLKRIIAMDPEASYDAYLGMGNCFQQNKNYTQAHDWYKKAIQVDQNRPQGYVADAYTWIQEGPYHDRARELFSKAREVAPECIDGYQGAAWLCEHEADEENDAQKKKLFWEESRKLYQACRRVRPEWESTLLVSLGGLSLKLGQPEAAQAELVAALTADPVNESASSSLQELALQYYRELNNPDKALQIYAALRKTIGMTYEADYQNLVGNLHYYFGSYNDARACYEKAVIAFPTNPVYHSNLASSIERNIEVTRDPRDLDKAISELKEAVALAPSDAEYVHRLQALQQRKQLLALYGDLAYRLALFIEPIWVATAPSLAKLVKAEQGEQLSFECLRLIREMHERLRGKFLFDIPAIKFWQEDSAEPNSYFIGLREVWVDSGRKSVDRKFAPGTFDGLPASMISLQPVCDLATGLEGCWIDKSDWAAAEQAGIPMYSPLEYMMRHLEVVLEKYLPELLTYEQIDECLSARGIKTWAEIRTTEKVLPVFIQFLKALLWERTNITPIELICNTFLELYKAGQGIFTIVEKVRQLPEIRQHVLPHGEQITIYSLSSDMERLLADCIYRKASQPLLAVPPRLCMDVLDHIRNSIRASHRCALLVQSSELRPLLRKMVEAVFGDLPVFSAAELADIVTGIKPEVIEPPLTMRAAS